MQEEGGWKGARNDAVLSPPSPGCEIKLKLGGGGGSGVLDGPPKKASVGSRDLPGFGVTQTRSWGQHRGAAHWP